MLVTERESQSNNCSYSNSRWVREIFIHADKAVKRAEEFRKGGVSKCTNNSTRMSQSPQSAMRVIGLTLKNWAFLIFMTLHMIYRISHNTITHIMEFKQWTHFLWNVAHKSRAKKTVLFGLCNKYAFEHIPVKSTNKSGSLKIVLTTWARLDGFEYYKYHNFHVQQMLYDSSFM